MSDIGLLFLLVCFCLTLSLCVAKLSRTVYDVVFHSQMVVIKGSRFVGLINLMPLVVKKDHKIYKLLSSFPPLSVTSFFLLSLSLSLCALSTNENPRMIIL